MPIGRWRASPQGAGDAPAGPGESGREGEGWEPASPTDWRQVVAADRFVAAVRAPRWWPLSGLLGGRPVVRQVVVRFRRAR